MAGCGLPVMNLKMNFSTSATPQVLLTIFIILSYTVGKHSLRREQKQPQRQPRSL